MRYENPEICYACRYSPCRCEMTELEQLKQDHATVKAARDIYERDYKGCDWIAMTGVMEKKIAKLEAEADPWKDAKAFLATMEAKTATCWQRDLASYVRNLEAENAAKEARIAELEAREVPPLDAKRVIRTAMNFMACNSCPYRDWNDVEPYPLQEPK